MAYLEDFVRIWLKKREYKGDREEVKLYGQEMALNAILRTLNFNLLWRWCSKSFRTGKSRVLLIIRLSYWGMNNGRHGCCGKVIAFQDPQIKPVWLTFAFVCLFPFLIFASWLEFLVLWNSEKVISPEDNLLIIPKVILVLLYFVSKYIKLRDSHSLTKRQS